MPLKQNIVALPAAAAALGRRRWGFAIVAGIALAALIITAADLVHWARLPHSDFYPSFFHIGIGRRTHVAMHGGLAISHQTRFAEHNDRYPNVRRAVDWDLLRVRFELVRWVFYPNWSTRGDNQTMEWGPIEGWELFLPSWLLGGISGAIVLRWTTLLRREVRDTIYRGGHCAYCGYDIRATPQRCPECGVIVPTAPAARVPVTGGVG